MDKKGTRPSTSSTTRGDVSARKTAVMGSKRPSTILPPKTTDLSKTYNPHAKTSKDAGMSAKTSNLNVSNIIPLLYVLKCSDLSEEGLRVQCQLPL